MFTHKAYNQDDINKQIQAMLMYKKYDFGLKNIFTIILPFFGCRKKYLSLWLKELWDYYFNFIVKYITHA